LKIYSFTQVHRLQLKGSLSDGIWCYDPKYRKNTKYELITVKLGEDIQRLSLREYATFTVEDAKQINKLKRLVKSGIKLSPIVVDAYHPEYGYRILDGWHRVAVYQELGIKKIKAFRKIE